jgi:hypothetical protein
LFIANWLDFDKAAPARKAAQSDEDREAKKEVLTYIDISSIMTEMSVTYARALQYLKVPTPTAGEYPTGDETATNLMVRLAHLHGNGQYFTGQANAVNGSNGRRSTLKPPPGAGTSAGSLDYWQILRMVRQLLTHPICCLTDPGGGFDTG